MQIAPSPRRPNFVVFFTDQQRWDSSGLHGNPLDLTPNFDRLARRGTHIYHSITCQPICGPARSALQTGLYPTTTGCFKNMVIPPAGTRMLGHYFSDAGYATGYIGKWHLAGNESKGPVRPALRGGYQYWLGSNDLEMTSDAYRCDVFDGAGKLAPLPGYRVDALADAAIRYIDQHQAEPFFLFLSCLEPHFQNSRDDYPAPVGYEEQYTSRWIPPDLLGLPGSWPGQLGGYWGMCKRLDEALGRIHDCLISVGLADDTVVLFTSDHGCSFKTRIPGQYKQSCHESAVRVPTMFSGGPFAGGGQIRQPVSLIDLPPTLLEAAGIPVPAAMQGRSILPLLHGKGENVGDWPHEVFIQISESEPGVGRAIRTNRWKYAVTALGCDSRQFPGSDRYVETELYDLLADRYELNNLIGMDSHRPLCDALKNRLIRRMTAAGESAPTVDNAPPRSGLWLEVLPEEFPQDNRS